MCPRSAPRRGRPIGLAAGLASPFLDSQLFQDEAEPGQDARLAALQGENAFRLAVEGDAREDLERRARQEGPDEERAEFEILGTNDMDAVANSLAIPYRWICRLEIDYDITPFGTAQRLTGGGWGTGTLISPCHVLTAAHNLVGYDPVRKNTLRATRIRVTPAHDGSSSPPVATVEADLSRSPVHRLWDITRRYDATGGPQNAGEVATNRYDYALLKLRSAIGDSRVRALAGPLGYWGTQGSGGAARLQRLEPAMLRSHTVFVAGYAGDDCVRAARTARADPSIRLGSQLTATGQITLVMEGEGSQYVGRSMAHDVDTCGSQSGAPVALELDGIYYLVGVHTAGVALTSGGRTNHAVRLTMEVSTQVSDWMARAPCPTAARELEEGGSLAGERLAVEEEDLALDSLDRGGEDETEDAVAGEAPAEWAMEWVDTEGESPLSTAGAEESEEDAAQLAEEFGYPDNETEGHDYPADGFRLDRLRETARHDPGLQRETSAPRAEVRALQKSLNTWRSEIGQTPIKEDGLLGAETRKAVLEFQKTSGLKRADGIAGPATQERLNLLLDILRNIPTSPDWIEDRRRPLELVGSAGFRSLEEPTQTEVLKRILSYQKPGTLNNIRHQTDLVTATGFELLPTSSKELMLRVLAARPDDAQLAGNLRQLIINTEFRNLDEPTQIWVLKRIKAYAGNHTSIDNLEKLITATVHFDQLSKESRNRMLLALAARPGDTLLVDNLRRAVGHGDFRGLDQQAQTDVLNRIVTYPRAPLIVDNLMSLVTTPGFGNLAPDVSAQVLDGLPSRFGKVPLSPVSIGHMMSLLTASGFQELRPEIRDLMLDALAERPDNMQLADGLRNLTENPKFRHDHRGARQSILQLVDSIP